MEILAATQLVRHAPALRIINARLVQMDSFWSVENVLRVPILARLALIHLLSAGVARIRITLSMETAAILLARNAMEQLITIVLRVPMVLTSIMVSAMRA